MKEVVLNKCYGGFSLSKEAYEYLGLEWDGYGFAYSEYAKRADPKLVECIKTLGERADGCFSKLRIVDVPDDIDLESCTSDYDGIETIEEPHMSW